MKLLKVLLLITFALAITTSCGRNSTNGNSTSSTFYSGFINSADGIADDSVQLSFGNVQPSPYPVGANAWTNITQVTGVEALIDVNGTFRIVQKGSTAGGYQVAEFFRGTWYIEGADFVVPGLGRTREMQTSGGFSFALVADATRTFTAQNGSAITLTISNSYPIFLQTL